MAKYPLALGSLLKTTEPEFADQFKNDDKTRRTVFVFGFTVAFSVAAAAIVLLGFASPVADTAVSGFLGLIQLMIIFYLTTSTVDRSEVLTNIGKGIRSRGENAANVTVLTPDQIRQFNTTGTPAAVTTTTTTTSPSPLVDDESVG